MAAYTKKDVRDIAIAIALGSLAGVLATFGLVAILT
jgi:hypothetical protein